MRHDLPPLVALRRQEDLAHVGHGEAGAAAAGHVAAAAVGGVHRQAVHVEPSHVTLQGHHARGHGCGAQHGHGDVRAPGEDLQAEHQGVLAHGHREHVLGVETQLLAKDVLESKPCGASKGLEHLSKTNKTGQEP